MEVVKYYQLHAENNVGDSTNKNTNTKESVIISVSEVVLVNFVFLSAGCHYRDYHSTVSLGQSSKHTVHWFPIKQMMKS